MNKITSEGMSLLARLSDEKLVFTKVLLDTGRSVDIIGNDKTDNVFTLKLRLDNLNLTENVAYSQIVVYAKIEGDSDDIIYAYVDKSSYIPDNTSVPEFVEDIDLCFIFSDLENITIENVGNVYALERDLVLKPTLFIGTTKPNVINSPYIWYQTFDEETEE